MAYQHTIQTIRSTLIETSDAVDKWFGYPVEIRARHPREGGWSIDEILEHITLTNHFLLIIIRKGCAKAVKRAATMPILEEESDLDALLPIGNPDAFYWIRPEHMEPTGTKPIEYVRSLMREQFQECLHLLDSMPNGEGSLYTVRMSVQNLGKIDMYQWLYFLALHAQRHLIEMTRIQHEWQNEHNRLH